MMIPPAFLSTSPEAPGEALLERYLLGECTPAERVAVDAWVQSVPGCEERLANIGIALCQAYQGDPASANRVTQRFFAEVMRGAKSETQDRMRRPRSVTPMSGSAMPVRLWHRFALPASIAGMALFAVLWQSLDGRLPQAAASRTYQTRHGEQLRVTLQDGSSILLRDGSRMAVVDASGDAPRTVTLQGEAYFTVASATHAPFLVRTSDAQAQVLGTAFAVRRYGADVQTQVVVKSGKVRVVPAMEHRSVVLAERMGALADSSRVRVMTDVQLDDALAWTERRLVFRKTPLHDAIPELERRYNVSLQIPKHIVDRDSLTARFTDDGLAQVLDVLALAFELRYTRTGHVITFTHAPVRAERRTPAPLQTNEGQYGR